jgi:hypothetical protein
LTFDVVLDEDKYAYLINEKQGKLKQVGLAEANRTQIKNRIKTKAPAAKSGAFCRPSKFSLLSFISKVL